MIVVQCVFVWCCTDWRLNDTVRSYMIYDTCLCIHTTFFLFVTRLSPSPLLFLFYTGRFLSDDHDDDDDDYGDGVDDEDRRGEHTHCYFRSGSTTHTHTHKIEAT